jgi:hypothetical protein
MSVLKKFCTLALVTTATLSGSLHFTGQPTRAQTTAPSLADGILCVARGKTSQGAKVYFYTSVIDGKSVNRKQPVTVTIVEPMGDVEAGEVVILDKKRGTVTFDAFEAATPPRMQPAGLARTVYQGKNTFSGKSQAGSNLSFTLSNNNRVFTVQHAGGTYTGVCH